MNNVYSGWEMYAIGGSANPTINSQGNVFIASDDGRIKEASPLSDRNLSIEKNSGMRVKLGDGFGKPRKMTVHLNLS